MTRLPFGGGAFLIAVPIFAAFVAASLAEGAYSPFSYANLAGFLWLAIAPDLLRVGKRELDRFGADIRPAFREGSHHSSYLRYIQTSVLSWRFLVISVPLGASSALLVWSRYPDLPIVARISHALFYSSLMFTAGIGFWAILAMLQAIGRLTRDDLVLDPYHWDGFGGYRCCGTFAVKWCTLFFTGSLLFPKALEILEAAGPATHVRVLAYLIPGSFLACGLTGFVYSQVLVRGIVKREKEREMRTLKMVLDHAYSEVRAKGLDAVSLKRDKFESLKRFNDFFYFRVGRVREWPFDYKVILQLVASALVPILMAAIELARLR